MHYHVASFGLGRPIQVDPYCFRVRSEAVQRARELVRDLLSAGYSIQESQLNICICVHQDPEKEQKAVQLVLAAGSVC